MKTTYVVVSARTADPVWRDVDKAILDLGIATVFTVGKLSVGTLDSLMAISDELTKVDTFCEAVSKKVAQQHEDLIEKKPELTVKSATPEGYITNFQWEEDRYSRALTLKELSQRLHQLVAKIDEELRLKSATYSTLAREIAAEARKEGTNLLTKPLNDIVKPNDFLETDYLTTLVVVVPKSATKEWMSTYETLTSFVLPGSSKCVAEDSEFGLYTVSLFKRVADDFKNLAREKHFTVRECSVQMLSKENAADREKRIADRDDLKAKLLRWCQTNFGEAFSAWIHVKALRIFVESVLRYGLPADFQARIIKVTRDEKKLLQAITKSFECSTSIAASAVANAEFSDESSGESFLPFVYTKIDLDFNKAH